MGEDRERSLVKLYKKLDENLDIVPPGVTGWVVKPVEIDDVPIVTLALRGESADGTDVTARRRGSHAATGRHPGRVAGLCRRRRAARGAGAHGPGPDGGVQRLAAGMRRAIEAANVRQTAGDYRSEDQLIRVETGSPLDDARAAADLVVGVFDSRPVFLEDVAAVEDGPEEISSYVRHGWGPARGFTHHQFFPGTVLGEAHDGGLSRSQRHSDRKPAVTIAIAKKKGTNAVGVAEAVLREAGVRGDRARRHGDWSSPQLRLTANERSTNWSRGWRWPSSSSWPC